MTGQTLLSTCAVEMGIPVSDIPCFLVHYPPWSHSAHPNIEVLKFLLPSLPASLLTATNENGSPPLHWAILNNHVAIVQMLVDVPEEQGGGLPILKVCLLAAFVSRGGWS